jgi:hypothetical protein
LDLKVENVYLAVVQLYPNRNRSLRERFIAANRNLSAKNGGSGFCEICLSADANDQKPDTRRSRGAALIKQVYRNFSIM